MTMSVMYYDEFQRVNWVFDVASSFFLSMGENKDQIIDECCTEVFYATGKMIK